MVHMITNSADLESGELGWGWKSIGGLVKKSITAPAKMAYKTTKWAAQKSIVAPTKILAKGTIAAGKSTVAVGTNIAKGNVTGAIKSAASVGLAPVKMGYETGRSAGKAAIEASKAVTNIALAPLRSRLNTLKSRRAQLISFQARGVKTPTTVEWAQARKDVKAHLSSKGPHGKMLSWLAGPDYTYDGLGVVGYDDAAIAAVATALTASLVKIISDAAKSKFAPKDAATAGLKAGASTAIQEVVPEKYQEAYRQAQATEAPAAAPAAARVAPPVPPPPPAEPVTQEEVAAEPVVQAEEDTTAAATEEMEGALADANLLGGFMEAAPAALAPEAMDTSMARKVAHAAQRMVCQMSAPAIAAIGGLEAVNAAGTFCRALAAGDEVAVRMTLPAVVQIAARQSAGLTARALNIGMRPYGMARDGFGSHTAAQRANFKACVKLQMDEMGADRSDASYACQDELQGFGGELGALRGKKAYAGRNAQYHDCVRMQMDEMGATASDAYYVCQGALQGADPNDVGMLAAFDGADPEGLSFGLLGVGAEDLTALAAADAIPTCGLLPMAFVVAAGFWLMTRG
jgi:hypothetical protein